ncbi:MAG: adenosine kinase [bacterium]|nr:adenosine kinase [bacterium]
MKTVLGIGNALVDVLIRLKDDSLLEKFELDKGSMTLVDRGKMNAVLAHTAVVELKEAPQKSSGGSVANTIHGLAQLGAPAGYIGKINDDDYGSFFRSYMEQNNIRATLFNGKEDTGKSIVLISSDSERTFATYLGAAIELDAPDLTLQPFQGYDYFHLEGYLVQNHGLVERSMQLAKEAGSMISIDLASFNIVEDNLEFLHSVVDRYVDIIFANEEEARAFSGKDDPTDALQVIAEKCAIAIVKTGKDGSLIKKDGIVYAIDAINANAVDTTGAGDLYAAGFFFGLVNGQPMDICGKIGAITAGNIVEVVGAKMEDSKWQLVRQLVNEL